MPRIFSALELPVSARTHLALLRGEIGGARWVDPGNMHLTLRFFGDISDAAADEITTRLEEIVADPIPVEISGTGAFGGRSGTTLYAAVKPHPALDALQKTHERIARLAGLPPPEHPFRPHVTLSRARHPRPSAIARFLAETGGLRLAPFTAERFVLLSSRPGTGGGPYALEAAVPLGDASSDADNHDAEIK